MGLVAREREIAALLQACAAAREGSGSVVVIRGEPGAGKTALLDVVAAEQSARLLRVTAVEAEQSIAFATLQALLWPLRDHVAELDPRQAAFLRPVLTLGDSRAGSTFAAAAAALALLSDAARAEPLVLIVDDVHLADGASQEALSFVARRLEFEPIALFAAARTGEPSRFADERSFTQLEVGPLQREAARILLSTVDGTLAPSVVDRLIEVTAGNPLGLIELPVLLSPAERAGEEPLPTAFEAGPMLQRAFANRIAGLARGARRALLVLAAAGDSHTAVAALDEGESALDEAEGAWLVSRQGGLEFRHPLVRSAVYSAASPAERREAHLALAAVSTGARRAWHLASAADRPDEDVASELEEVAQEARTVGGAAAEAQALERAAALTPAPDRHAARLLGAAHAWRRAGRVAHAHDLLDEALPLATEAKTRVEIRLEQGQNLIRERAARDAYELLHTELEATTDPELGARLNAATALAANVYEDGPSPLGFAERALDLARGRGDAVELEALFAAVTARMARPSPPEHDDVEIVERAAELLALPALRTGEPPHWIAYALAELERDDESRRLSDVAVAEARDEGDVWSLCYGLYARAASELSRGRVDSARSWAAEAVPLAEQIGEPWRLSEAAIVMNEVQAARGNSDAIVADLDGTPVPEVDLILHRGRAHLAVGRLPEAVELLDHAHRALAGEIPRAWFRLVPLDLAEAHALSGEGARAESVLREAAPSIESCRLVRPRAKLERVRGLLASDGQIDRVFSGAAAHLETVPHPLERARLELNWAERLARAGRTADALMHAQDALARFEALGAVGWAERARRVAERASGAAIPAPPRRTDDLTPQELRVARHAASGLRDREIAALLYLSPRTVSSYLASAYRKVGVANRTQLAAVLSAEGVEDP